MVITKISGKTNGKSKHESFYRMSKETLIFLIFGCFLGLLCMKYNFISLCFSIRVHIFIQGDPKLLPPLSRQNGVHSEQIDVHSRKYI